MDAQNYCHLENSQINKNKEYSRNLQPDDIDRYVGIINEYRDQLTHEVNPYGNNYNDYEICKPQDELHKVLFNIKLYHYGDYTITQRRLYARYFYYKLAQKSRELMSDLLILESSNNKDENDSSKGHKKNNEYKRRNKKGIKGNKKKQNSVKDNDS